jgi:molecular chaperone DnaK
MRITPTSGLSPDEINRLIMEAESSVDSDRYTKETIMLRNKLDSLVRNTQRTFAEFGSSLSDNDQQMGKRALSEGEAAAKSDELEKIRSALSDVERLAGQLTNVMLSAALEEEVAPEEIEGAH